MNRAGLLALILIGELACGTTAQLHLTDGRVLEGRIDSSTKDALVLGETSIPRSQIREIDHPGNGAAIAGGTLVAGGIGLYLDGDRRGSKSRESPEALGGFGDAIDGGVEKAFGIILIAAGLGVGLYGTIVWDESRKRAQAPRVVATPIVTPGHAGATLVLRF